MERRVVPFGQVRQRVLDGGVVPLHEEQLRFHLGGIGILGVAVHGVAVETQLVAELAEFGDLATEGQLFPEHPHLLGEFGDYEAGPPAEGALGPEDVGVEMISDVHDLLSGLDVEHGGQVLPVPALEGLALGQELRSAILSKCLDLKQAVGVEEGPILRTHAEEVEVRIGQVRRLAGPDDDDIEQVHPLVLDHDLRRFLPLVVQEVHGDGGVLPVGVGQKEYLDARFPVGLEHGDEVGVRDNVLLRVARHLILDDAVAVAQVDALPDLAVDLPVGLFVEELVLTLVLHLDEGGEEVSVDELEECVHVDEVLFGEGGDLVEHAVVQVLASNGGDGLEAMVGETDVLVTVDLEEVAALRVDDQASDPKRVIVFEVQNLLRIPQRVHQFLLRTVERQFVELRLVVLRQRVVHVEPDRLDPAQLQFAIAEHVVGTDGTFRWQVGQGAQFAGKADGGQEVVEPSSGGTGLGGGVSVHRRRRRVSVHRHCRVRVSVQRWVLHRQRRQRTVREELLGGLVLVEVVRGRGLDAGGGVVVRRREQTPLPFGRE
mmetsp:Transcript_24822/g.50414  ORF Transcript_24822/g.50414 Transcript_24822/m.50414 type:complete len:544 (-) Transcript_24822:38-1669(-)